MSSKPLYFTQPCPEDIACGDGPKVINFIETYCSTTNDSFGSRRDAKKFGWTKRTGNPMVLRPWQKSLIMCMYARNHKDYDDETLKGAYCYQTLLVGLPRKQGKSSLAAPLALYALYTSIDEGVRGFNAVVCASSKKQASGIVFRTAKEIVTLNDDLNQLISPFRSLELRNADLDCSFCAIAAVAEQQEGLNPNFIVYDELHTAQDAELFHTMQMSQGGRPDAMMLAITTAGQRVYHNEKSICFQQYEYGKQVISGEKKDSTFFFAWWGAPDGADWTDPAVWEAANPGWNDLKSAKSVRKDFDQLHSSQFKTKHLNMFVNQFSSWLPDNVWRACESTAPFEDEGQGIILGFDGSISGDATALVAMTISASPVIRVIGLWEKPDSAGAEWRVDHDAVKERIREACRRYDVREVACDEYLWISDLQELEAEGIPIVKFPKSPAFMIPATQAFYEDVISMRIQHDPDKRQDAALTRHLENVLLKQTSRGPMLTRDRGAAGGCIDLAMCAVMANARVKHYLSEEKPFDPSTIGNVW